MPGNDEQGLLNGVVDLAGHAVAQGITASIGLALD